LQYGLPGFRAARSEKKMVERKQRQAIMTFEGIESYYSGRYKSETDPARKLAVLNDLIEDERLNADQKVELYKKLMAIDKKEVN
jgi:hypothetical protein